MADEFDDPYYRGLEQRRRNHEAARSELDRALRNARERGARREEAEILKEIARHERAVRI